MQEMAEGIKTGVELMPILHAPNIEQDTPEGKSDSGALSRPISLLESDGPVAMQIKRDGISHQIDAWIDSMEVIKKEVNTKEEQRRFEVERLRMKTTSAEQARDRMASSAPEQPSQQDYFTSPAPPSRVRSKLKRRRHDDHEAHKHDPYLPILERLAKSLEDLASSNSQNMGITRRDLADFENRICQKFEQSLAAHSARLQQEVLATLRQQLEGAEVGNNQGN
ncbi:MAG: hypothetical protein M1837_000413 [Sclerophora amabilis]|nr:MAG: hypothetical protein M1837_000413 [Sclerophora amabilis]